MNPNENFIKWQHIVDLQSIDHGMPHPKYPKLTLQHVKLNNSARMTVGLATLVSYQDYFCNLKLKTKHSHFHQSE